MTTLEMSLQKVAVYKPSAIAGVEGAGVELTYTHVPMGLAIPAA
jgi:hypothetical protein